MPAIWAPRGRGAVSYSVEGFLNGASVGIDAWTVPLLGGLAALRRKRKT
ncbi:hypothetical protein QO034_03270 [Sedimentitalea sp. JM2-8]|uniref:VPEID-CTERM protein sorting domain-containing protein n=1 Tax=Sedimentitalea xiamensis TaxID=3050037 RepID=A0ABT7FAJ6_9RHOB|nr:hypothetical protein [Sedimentitalea xiamensis]